MLEPSPWSRLARLALLPVLATALATHSGVAVAAAHRPILTLDEQGCHYNVRINRLLLSLPQYHDMQIHADQQPARFAFGDLHGIGIVESWDGVWMESRLYFREDVSALAEALRLNGLGVEGNGHVVLPSRNVSTTMRQPVCEIRLGAVASGSGG